MACGQAISERIKILTEEEYRNMTMAEVIAEVNRLEAEVERLNEDKVSLQRRLNHACTKAANRKAKLDAHEEAMKRWADSLDDDAEWADVIRVEMEIHAQLEEK